MKNTIFIISIFLWGMAQAQIPNSGFENWHPVANGQGEDPDHWESNNLIVDTPGIVKSTDAYSGNYALRINATAIPEQSPVIYLGSIDFDTTFTTGNFPGSIIASCAGKPIQNVPQVLTGYYKFVAPSKNKGTAGISVEAVLGCVGWPSYMFPVGGSFNNFRTSGDSTGIYRFFAVAMQEEFTLNEPLDTLRIAAQIAIDTNFGEVGEGYLLLDDLGLLGTIGQREMLMEEASFSVFPNPAGEQLYIEISESFKAHTLQIYDLKGGFVLETPFHSPLDISALAPAMYLVKIQGEQGELMKTFVVR